MIKEGFIWDDHSRGIRINRHGGWSSNLRAHILNTNRKQRANWVEGEALKACLQWHSFSSKARPLKPIQTVLPPRVWLFRCLWLCWKLPFRPPHGPSSHAIIQCADTCSRRCLCLTVFCINILICSIGGLISYPIFAIPSSSCLLPLVWVQECSPELRSWSPCHSEPFFSQLCGPANLQFLHSFDPMWGNLPTLSWGPIPAFAFKGMASSHWCDFCRVSGACLVMKSATCITCLHLFIPKWALSNVLSSSLSFVFSFNWSHFSSCHLSDFHFPEQDAGLNVSTHCQLPFRVCGSFHLDYPSSHEHIALGKTHILLLLPPSIICPLLMGTTCRCSGWEPWVLFT